MNGNSNKNGIDMYNDYIKYRKEFENILMKIEYNKVLSNLRYKNINFRINSLIITNLSIITYLLYKQ
jgi:hypothetical protein